MYTKLVLTAFLACQLTGYGFALGRHNSGSGKHENRVSSQHHSKSHKASDYHTVTDQGRTERTPLAAIQKDSTRKHWKSSHPGETHSATTVYRRPVSYGEFALPPTTTIPGESAINIPTKNPHHAGAAHLSRSKESPATRHAKPSHIQAPADLNRDAAEAPSHSKSSQRGMHKPSKLTPDHGSPQAQSFPAGAEPSEIQRLVPNLKDPRPGSKPTRVTGTTKGSNGKVTTGTTRASNGVTPWSKLPKSDKTGTAWSTLPVMDLKGGPHWSAVQSNLKSLGQAANMNPANWEPGDTMDPKPPVGTGFVPFIPWEGEGEPLDTDE